MVFALVRDSPPACPLWCVECWEPDPGTRFHHGPAAVWGGFRVAVERYDDGTGPGSAAVSVLAPLDASLRPDQARALAAALLAAADEAEQQ